MAKRDRQQPRLTPEEQAAELAKIQAEDAALIEQLRAVDKRRKVLAKRRQELSTQLMREHLQARLGEFVKLTGSGHYLVPARRLQPLPGDVGRLLKIGRTRTLVDFGEELHTWYVALEGVGEVYDPLKVAEEKLLRDRAEMERGAKLEEYLDTLTAGEDLDEDGDIP